MLVRFTIDVDTNADAAKLAEIRRLLILVELLGCEIVSYDEHVAAARLILR